MASTAGRTSSRVRTERTPVSVSDFQAEIFRLEGDAESHNWLIYGDSNVGKTVLSGTAPGKTFWLVCEPGYKSAARHNATGSGRIIADTATAWAAVDWLADRERYRKIDWLILDGLSTMQDRFRLGYAAEAFDIDPSKRQHRNLPDRPDYFNTQNFLKAWIPQLVDLPVNLLITAHAYRTDKTEDGELLVFPGVQGKVTETANAIAGLMDITGYMTSRRMPIRDSDETRLVRRIYFESPAPRKGEDEVRYICGEKYGVLGAYMSNPTIPKLLAKVEGTEERS
jgi:hypothetical protein